MIKDYTDATIKLSHVEFVKFDQNNILGGRLYKKEVEYIALKMSRFLDKPVTVQGKWRGELITTVFSGK